MPSPTWAAYSPKNRGEQARARDLQTWKAAKVAHMATSSTRSMNGYLPQGRLRGDTMRLQGAHSRSGMPRAAPGQHLVPALQRPPRSPPWVGHQRGKGTMLGVMATLRRVQHASIDRRFVQEAARVRAGRLTATWPVPCTTQCLARDTCTM